jgi:hypothetical protein
MWFSWLLVRLAGVALLTGVLFYPQIDRDIFEYYGWAVATLHGHLPWRSFRVEYPPGVFPAMLLPGGWKVFELEFITAALLADAYIGSMLWRHRRNGLGAWCWVLAPVAIGPVMWVRFDVFVAAALCGMVAALRAGHWRRAGACIAAATLLKLWPIALLLVLWRLIPREGRRVVAAWAAGVVVAATLPVVAWGGGSGLLWMLHYQGNRGLEWETVWALPAVIAHSFNLSVPLHASHQTIEYALSGSASAAWSMLLPALVLVVAFVVWRAGNERFGYASATLLAVSAVFVGGKVLSSQYVTWAAAAAVLALDESPLQLARHRAHVLLSTLALGLSAQFLYPIYATYAYWGYFRGDLAAIAHAEAVAVWTCVVAAYTTRRKTGLGPAPITARAAVTDQTEARRSGPMPAGRGSR